MVVGKNCGILKKPPPLSPCLPINSKVRSLRITVKKTDLHSVFQTVIRSCECPDYVNFMSFSDGFLPTLSTRPFTVTLILVQMEGV